MNEQVRKEIDSVFWVNRFSKSTIQSVLLAVGIRKPNEEPFMTSIAVNEIDAIEDEELRSALLLQHDNLETRADAVIVPIVHMPDRLLSHTFTLTTVAANTRFSEYKKNISREA
jgi:hypothetical protein